MRGLYLRGGTWWVSLSVGGRRYRISTGITGGTPANPPRAAQLFHAEKLAEIGRGNLAGLQAYRLTVADILDMLATKYRAENRPSAKNVPMRTRMLKAEYGRYRASELTTDRILEYCVKRRDVDHAAVATINVEMAYLRQAYGLAHRAGRIAWIPHVPRLPGAKVRQGFLEKDTLPLILKEMDPWYRPVVRFLRLTGWREGEGLGLEWRRVDWQAEEIRLDTSKTGEPRTLPFGTYPDLRVLLLEQDHLRQDFAHKGVFVSLVFPSRRGQKIHPSALQRAWRPACERAGVGHLVIHDMRRSMVRDMERAGISRSVAMKITGHRSEEVYRRYAIVARVDVQEGLSKLVESKAEPVLLPFVAGTNQSK